MLFGFVNGGADGFDGGVLIGDAALHPTLRSRYARQGGRHARHFAGLLARDQIELAGDAQGNPHPLAPDRAVVAHLRGDRAPAPLELCQQLVRPVPQ